MRNNEIDKLRAFAVIGTVFAHISDLWMWNVEWISKAKLYINGYDGVLLFFCISGYVISSSFVYKFDKHRESKNIILVLKSFFVKRFFRITPSASFWAVFLLLVTFAIDPQMAIGNAKAACAAILNYFNIYTVLPSSLPNLFGVYWSLSLEEQFYLIFPIFLFLIPYSFSRIFAISIALICLLFASPQIKSMFQLEPILFGVLLYILESKFKLRERFSKYILFPRWILMSLASLLIVGSYFLSNLRPILGTYYLFFVGFYFSCLVFLASLEKNTILPIKLFDPILKWLGDRSYVIYLAHFPLILLVRHFWITIAPKVGFAYSNENNLLIFITWLVCTVISVELFCQFFEKPLMNKGREISGLIERKISQ